MTVLEVVHTTRLHYAGIVHASRNEIRMRPAELIGQRVLLSSLRVTPHTRRSRRRDHWGNVVDAVEVLEPHDLLTVVATSRVERDGPAPAPAPLAPAWDALRHPAVVRRAGEMLAVTATTAPPPDLVELARDAAAGHGVHAAARAVCDAVRADMSDAPGASDVRTKACEAWTARAGVCQDLTHVALGALRSLGIPARYVSGYLHPRPDLPAGVRVSGGPHAWLEYFSGHWCAYDPTLPGPVTDRHVLVARGREYDDVAPFRGVYRGGGAARQRAEVEITVPVAAATDRAG